MVTRKPFASDRFFVHRRGSGSTFRMRWELLVVRLRMVIAEQSHAIKSTCSPWTLAVYRPCDLSELGSQASDRCKSRSHMHRSRICSRMSSQTSPGIAVFAVREKLKPTTWIGVAYRHAIGVSPKHAPVALGGSSSTSNPGSHTVGSKSDNRGRSLPRRRQPRRHRPCSPSARSRWR